MLNSIQYSLIFHDTIHNLVHIAYLSHNSSPLSSILLAIIAVFPPGRKVDI